MLLLRLFKEQFGVNIYYSLKLAYFSGRAAIVFRKTENVRRTIKWLTSYYKLVDKIAIESFSPRKAAELEFRWWLLHRHPSKREKIEIAVAKSMAILYDVKPNVVTAFAEHRVAAMRLRDTATHHDRIEPDWSKIETELIISYTELKNAVNSVQP